ncbi:MAG TPA: hypothetical protein PK400_02480 [Phycisphaerales bacterium]|nr:hypothetical protein [Phycisphaerales bacterium]
MSGARSSALVAAALIVFLAAELTIITVVLILIGTPAPAAVIVAIVFVGLPLLVLAVVVRLTWRPFLSRYPAQPVMPDAVSKGFQSFRFGPIGAYNNCIRIMADERHLHLEGMGPIRWFGAARMSVPWEAMTEASPSRLPGMIRARLGDQTVAGPEWCMKLAVAGGN